VHLFYFKNFRYAYNYDIFDRLIAEECGDTKTEFTYNSAGNITSKSVYKKAEDTGDFILDKDYYFVYNTSVWGDQLLQIDIGGNVPCESKILINVNHLECNNSLKVIFL